MPVSKLWLDAVVYVAVPVDHTGTVEELVAVVMPPGMWVAEAMLCGMSTVSEAL
jgi:hypothetical protein